MIQLPTTCYSLLNCSDIDDVDESIIQNRYLDVLTNEVKCLTLNLNGRVG